MTPEQTFNHHMKAALKALKACPPKYIGRAYRGTERATKAVMFKEAAKLWQKGGLESEISREFGFQQVVTFARRALGPDKVPYQKGHRGGHVPTVQAWCNQLKKPGDVVMMPLAKHCQRVHVLSWCGVRGIRVSTDTRNQPKGMMRIVCTRHVPYEEEMRKAKLAAQSAQPSDLPLDTVAAPVQA